MPRRPKEKVDIDVVPYLSIMVIVLKLICLILVVTVMRIAMNPHAVKAVTIEHLFGVERKHIQARAGHASIKIPTYFECSSGGIKIYPGEKVVPLSDLSMPDNMVEQAIEKIRQNATNEFAIVIVRPHGVKEYRHVRKLLTEAQVDIGYDVFEEETVIDFKKSAKNAGIVLEP